jgi:DNA-binding transcriptional regulator YdaS (Cro superfamily)
MWAKLDRVPTRYLKKIEELTEGRIKPEDLRPELALPNFNNPKLYMNPINQIEQEDE